MTSTVPELLPAPRAAWVDRWRIRIHASPARTRLYAWLVPALITVLAGILRLTNLGQPHAIVFDETYYVKDAWSQWVLGYPSAWPEEADTRFLAGETDVWTGVGSFVVHPPLGKFLIGIGMALFGPDSSFGWRFSVALAGTALVLLTYLVAKALTGSVAFAGVAGFLLAIDGLAIVMSRVALLDTFLAVFILLAFWFVLRDRRRHLDRLAALVVARGGDGPPAWGPVLWNRPWLVAAGAAVGAASAVKWSGLYVAAGLGLYVVVTDALARRRAGIGFWPTDAVFRQGIVSFLLFVPVALVVYLASWTGWLVTDGGYDRHSADDEPATGVWGWVPLALQSLWRYHQGIYAFHVGLSSPHGYASPAWQWPLLIRPTSMYWNQDGDSVEAVSSLPNPLLWWAGVAAVLYLVVRVVLTRGWGTAVVLLGVAVTYVPWLLYPERTIFQFYTVAILPFLVLALVYTLRDLAGRSDGDPARRIAGVRAVAVFLVVVTAVSVFWYPVWTALPVPYEFWRLHNWLLTWI